MIYNKFKIEVSGSVSLSLSTSVYYCYLSGASNINNSAEAYSKVNSMLFNNLSNYHYLLTKKKATLVFSLHAVALPGTLAMVLQRLHVHFQTP